MNEDQLNLESIIENLALCAEINEILLVALSSFLKNTSFFNIEKNIKVDDEVGFSFRSAASLCEYLGIKYKIPDQGYYWTLAINDLLKNKRKNNTKFSNDFILDKIKWLMFHFEEKGYRPIFSIDNDVT